MRYKLTVTSSDYKSIEDLHKLISKSHIYASPKSPPIMLSSITEVCDECAKRGC